MNMHKISLHPKLGAALESLAGILFFILLKVVPNLTLLVVLVVARVGFSALLTYGLVYFPPAIKRWQHLVTVAVFELGIMPLFLFTDWAPALYLLFAVSIVCPAASFWLMPHGAGELSFVLKPYRRLGLLMTTLAVVGMWSGALALFVFQLVPWFSWWILFLAAVVATLLGIVWWLRYEVPLTRRSFVVAAVIGLALWQFSFLALVSPAGNFVGGVILAWFWYTAFLMNRFYLSPAGLNFKKQVPFVVINIILVLVYLLFVVRWK